jgi:hypothetical protein
VTRKGQDLFLQLSIETKATIISCLQDGFESFQAVARLRLSSRAFKQLPQSFYRSLTVTLMPFIWEVQDLIAEERTVDWQKLWKRLSRADGFHKKPTERKGSGG